MFLYYIPQPNKQQPHNVVLKNPLKKRNWISFHFHLSNWSALFLWDLFTGFISFLLPWSLPAAAKKNISCWKENMKTSLNVNVQRRHWGKKCSRSYWRWYFYQLWCWDFIFVSNVDMFCVSPVKCCVCCERSKLSGFKEPRSPNIPLLIPRNTKNDKFKRCIHPLNKTQCQLCKRLAGPFIIVELSTKRDKP